MTDTLLEAVQAVAPHAAPYYAGHRHGDACEIFHHTNDEVAAGYIIVTPDGPDSYAIGVYTTANWEDCDGDGEIIDDLAATDVVRIVSYLTTCQPEGTSWAAWAKQRISDDGIEVGR